MARGKMVNKDPVEKAINDLESILRSRLENIPKRIRRVIRYLEKQKEPHFLIRFLSLDDEVNFDVMLEIAKGIYQTEREAGEAVGILRGRMQKGKIITNSEMMENYNRLGGSGSGNLAEITLQRVAEGYMNCIK